MNEHEANVERVDQLGKSLDDAMLDALNKLPADERAVVADKIRDGLTDLPKFRVVDVVRAATFCHADDGAPCPTPDLCGNLEECCWPR